MAWRCRGPPPVVRDSKRCRTLQSFHLRGLSHRAASEPNTVGGIDAALRLRGRSGAPRIWALGSSWLIRIGLRWRRTGGAIGLGVWRAMNPSPSVSAPSFTWFSATLENLCSSLRKRKRLFDAYALNHPVSISRNVAVRQSFRSSPAASDAPTCQGFERQARSRGDWRHRNPPRRFRSWPILAGTGGGLTAGNRGRPLQRASPWSRFRFRRGKARNFSHVFGGCLSNLTRGGGFPAAGSSVLGRVPTTTALPTRESSSRGTGHRWWC